MYRWAISLAFLAFGVVNAQTACNGYAEYCSKPYNSLTHVLTHNSYGYIANPAANQLCPVTTQLADGVRGLKLSAINPSNTTTTTATSQSIYLCHTSCSILNAGPAVETLGNVTEWLKNNPNEVLTISWNNLGGFALDAFEAAYNASGILEYTYTQTTGNYTWPTIQEMINSGKRVVNFIDTGADQSTLPWLLDEFSYVFETPYDNRNASSFSCVIDRPTDPSNPDQMMYIMNHFLYGTLTLGSTVIEIPQKGTANVTNSEGSLLSQATTCTSTFGRQPNFLEVDFYNLGNTLEIAATLNNVTYNGAATQCDAYAAQAANSDQGSSEANRIFASSTLLLSMVAATFFVFF